MNVNCVRWASQTPRVIEETKPILPKKKISQIFL